MRLIGFNFTKISVEKFREQTENVKFNTKIDISSIEAAKTDILKIKEEPLIIKFLYSVAYEPDLAKLELQGNLILSVDSRTAKEVLRGWKDKETSEDFRITLFNIILKKSNVKALELEEEMNLPYHIPLPTLNKENIHGKKD